MQAAALRLAALLTDSTLDVFDRMVSRQVTPAPPIDGEALRPKSSVVATVGFTGSEAGLVAFYSTIDAAREIAGSMLGLPPAEVDGNMPDAIGQLASLIAGGLCARMTDAGHQWALSIPAVTTGPDLHTACAPNASRALCPFRMDGQEIFVELILSKRPPPSPAPSGRVRPGPRPTSAQA